MPNPVDPTLPNVTDGKQRSQGFELSVAGRVFTGLNVFRQLYLPGYRTGQIDNSIQRRQRTRKTCRNIARLSGPPTTSSRSFRSAAVRLTLEVDTRTPTTRNRAPGYVRWDSTIAYNVTPKLQLRLNALNFTNDHHYETTHPSHVTSRRRTHVHRQRKFQVLRSF